MGLVCSSRLEEFVADLYSSWRICRSEDVHFRSMVHVVRLEMYSEDVPIHFHSGQCIRSVRCVQVLVTSVVVVVCNCLLDRPDDREVLPTGWIECRCTKNMLSMYVTSIQYNDRVHICLPFVDIVDPCRCAALLYHIHEVFRKVPG